MRFYIEVVADQQRNPHNEQASSRRRAMAKCYDYQVFSSNKRVASRVIVRMDASGAYASPEQSNRTFVPFTGFDGQKLAGTGALVWEGELLRERLH